ncbi:hypothetical protein DFH28DRAFT_823216, partial [Melampsora americana]
PDTSGAEAFRNCDSRHHAKKLNGLMGKVSLFCSRIALRSNQQLGGGFTQEAKSLHLRILPSILGYKATSWNAEFNSLNWLVQARPFYEKAFGPQHPHTIQAGNLFQDKFNKHQKVIEVTLLDEPKDT